MAQFLAEQHGFRLLTLESQPLQPSTHADSSHATQANGLKGHNQNAVQLANSKTMLDYVTDRWNDRFVTLDLTMWGDLDAFIKRPFFLCVEVGGPLLMRWERYQSKYGSIGLEQFVKLDDKVSYGASVDGTNSPSAGGQSMLATASSSSSIVGGNGIIDNLSSISLHPPTTPSPTSPPTGLTNLRRYTHLSINNDFPALPSLFSHLTSLNLPSSERLRPCWDTYFLRLCNLASLRSNCMKRRVGAVLVASNRILATGYNGTPSGLRNCNQGGCARCNNTLPSASPSARPGLERTGSSACGQNLEECLCLHAEENALLEAGRGKIAAGGATMYCNTCPCLRCAVKIVQTGIRRVVYQLEYSMDERTKSIFREAGVEFLQFHLDA